MDIDQSLLVAVLSSTGTAGLFGLLIKILPTQESKTNLVEIGNELAKDLLSQAREERNELRKTIQELRTINVEKRDTIKCLTKLAEEKDRVIHGMELRATSVATKLEMGLPVTNLDIFGIELTQATRDHRVYNKKQEKHDTHIQHEIQNEIQGEIEP